jgi:agmatinase
LNRILPTFIGCDKSYDEADLVLFGAPYDSTASYRPGARFAAGAMRAASAALETYSPYQNRDLQQSSVHDYFDLDLAPGEPGPALRAVENLVGQLIRDHKTPVMIGGEHLLSLGAARALAQNYPDLCVVQFDAHTDLRSEYLGQSLSHATIMRRIWDLLGNGRIFQFGVRSGAADEFAWAPGHVFLQKYDFSGLAEVCVQLRGRPVYFTLDLDVLDPSCFPGAGTPEAGGVNFTQLLDAVLQVAGLNLVGVDINELCPDNDASGVSTLTACKLLREIILAIS